jgi:beta-galactosidase/beta-glucuronidase
MCGLGSGPWIYPRDGFLLNGERVDIKGVCNHHDLGALEQLSTPGQQNAIADT